MKRASALVVILAAPRRCVTVPAGGDGDTPAPREREHDDDWPRVSGAQHHARDQAVRMLNSRIGFEAEGGFVADAAGTAKTSLRRHAHRHAERLLNDSDQLYTMNGSAPLPEHGFSGRLVAHSDGHTYTNDWHKEYGPHAEDSASLRDICAQYPTNEWCRVNGRYHNWDHAHPPKTHYHRGAHGTRDRPAPAKRDGPALAKGGHSDGKDAGHLVPWYSSREDSRGARTTLAAGAPSLAALACWWPW